MTDQTFSDLIRQRHRDTQAARLERIFGKPEDPAAEDQAADTAPPEGGDAA